MSFLTANNKQDQDEYWLDKLIPAFENANSFPTADNKQDQCCLNMLIPVFKNINTLSTANTKKDQVE